MSQKRSTRFYVERIAFDCEGVLVECLQMKREIYVELFAQDEQQAEEIRYYYSHSVGKPRRQKFLDSY